MKRELLSMVMVALLLLSVSGSAEEIKNPGDIVYTFPVKAVLFSHYSHVKKASIQCDTCHPAIFKTKALAVESYPDFNMQALYDGKYCGACHNGGYAFSSDTQCARCHIGVKGANMYGEEIGKIKDMSYYMPKNTTVLGEGMYAASFNHNVHNVFECDTCHTSIFSFSYTPGEITMAKISEGKYCGECHNGEMAFASTNCVACHSGLSER
ncbi:MAG: hypothetical protein GXO99_07725 [Nitrospirae bacterium]|nr:hypothetical protein [Nitrospirota bacterium]